MSLTIQCDDEDTRKFAQELREECVVLYKQMLITASDTDRLNELEPSLPQIFDYVEQLIALEGYANMSMTKNVIGLVGDVVSVYGGGNAIVKAKATGNHIEQSIL